MHVVASVSDGDDEEDDLLLFFGVPTSTERPSSPSPSPSPSPMVPCPNKSNSTNGRSVYEGKPVRRSDNDADDDDVANSFWTMASFIDISLLNR